MLKIILRLGTAQAVAWGSFGASIALTGYPVWIPAPVTMFVIQLGPRIRTYLKRSE